MPAPLVNQLREMELTKADKETLLRLENELMTSYLKQYAQLLQRSKTDDRVDAKSPGSKWREICKAENLRVFEETSPEATTISSMMMRGTVVGSLDDVLFGVVAATDAAQRIKERVLRDGVEQSKVLHRLVQPTERDPTRHLPRFDHRIIDRGNRSVCVFYRQRTPTAVECYARGFFDLETEVKRDPIVNSGALQVVANRWLSHARITELSQMKKLAWRLKEHGDTGATPRKPSSIRSACSICNKSIGLLGSVKACGICRRSICARCCVKNLVCALDAVPTALGLSHESVSGSASSDATDAGKNLPRWQ
ncbi:hypothetical protein PHYPSEUDO_008373 [Phytophthora pseudosyringae]|uniref:FYVE-type domain-containing protein n=1 Tax=Phytophthora pseudosyringae TaxID=221518 RepID=A0A8T1WAA4_9STRA|nr:hypothetical protein PHYPSEUDO_008373 [Phytophthora pseudosyringae]